jgi:hypothetical protein
MSAFGHSADNPTTPAFVRYWTKADNGSFWATMVCRHWCLPLGDKLTELDAPLTTSVIKKEYKEILHGEIPTIDAAQ